MRSKLQHKKWSLGRGPRPAVVKNRPETLRFSVARIQRGFPMAVFEAGGNLLTDKPASGVFAFTTFASCATLLLVQGVSPRVVMEVLGHSEIALTMNAYRHVVPELRRDAAQRMQAILER